MLLSLLIYQYVFRLCLVRKINIFLLDIMIMVTYSFSFSFTFLSLLNIFNLSNATDTNYFTTILQTADVAKLLLVFI